MGLAEVLEVAAGDPLRCALFTDFDGVLSEIVDDPSTVHPIEGVSDVMTSLVDSLGTVAVVSGRPISFLDGFFAPPIELSGLYGLERRSGDQVLVDAAALEWLPVMSQTADEARQVFGLEAVEDKRYSLTIHYRRSDPDVVDLVRAWTTGVAERTGLDARDAKMSIELHPPTGRTKGDAVGDLLVGMGAAMYMGDDVGDLPAFERLRTAKADGEIDEYATVLVASHETHPEMHELATDVVNDPVEALSVLRQLSAASS